MKQEIKSLVEISQKIGAFEEFAQGGGGNISVKLANGLMAIKASGFFLKQVKEDNGFAVVDCKKIEGYIKQNDALEVTEESLTEVINSSIVNLTEFPKLRPSIETGFHAAIKNKFVVHTHSVYANLLCCSQEGESLAKALFPHSLWVHYANPGKEITFKINSLLRDEKIIFMQNHGIIVAGETQEEVCELHNFANEKIMTFFNLKNNYNTEKLPNELEFAKQNVIFPDQVVYLLSEELQKSVAGVQTLNAYSFIVNNKFAYRSSPTISITCTSNCWSTRPVYRDIFWTH